MKKIAIAFSVLAIMLVAGTWYCILIWHGEIHPTLISWILFGLTTASSLLTYFRSEGKRSWLSSANNIADTAITWGILISLLVFGQGVRYDLTHFEAWCIVGVIGVLVYWKVSQQANIANIAINAIMVIAYLPMFIELWNAKENPESFPIWGAVFLAGILALYNPIKERDWLALVYPVRAVLMSGLVLLLMIRLEVMSG